MSVCCLSIVMKAHFRWLYYNIPGFQCNTPCQIPCCLLQINAYMFTVGVIFFTVFYFLHYKNKVKLYRFVERANKETELTNGKKARLHSFFYYFSRSYILVLYWYIGGMAFYICWFIKAKIIIRFLHYLLDCWLTFFVLPGDLITYLFNVMHKKTD